MTILLLRRCGSVTTLQPTVGFSTPSHTFPSHQNCISADYYTILVYYSSLNPERCLSIVSTCSPLCFPTYRYRYKLHRDHWHGLWWVILLQYTHVVYASMSILNCPNIRSQSSKGGSVSGLQLFPDAVSCVCYKEALLLMHTSILFLFCSSGF